jgi:micrococcal nuclease
MTATMTVDYRYNAVIDRIVDGDTVVVIIDLGFRASMKLSLRLYGIDTPELKNPSGKEARKYLQSRLPQGTTIVINTFKNKYDKYGRWLGELWLESENLNQTLITVGHAIPYFGEGK